VRDLDGRRVPGGICVVLVLVALPLLLLAAVAVLAFVSVRNSTLRITADGVEYRNYPQPSQSVALTRVVRFEDAESFGNFSSLRPATAVLVLTDGTRLPVRSLTDPEAGTGVDALNARVQALRSGP
jgi:hypothetical protein